MQARIVLWPPPEARKSPHASPALAANATSTVYCARRLAIATSSTLRLRFPPCKHVREPRQRQRACEKDDEQRHHRGQSEVFEIGPNRHRHTGRIIRGH